MQDESANATRDDDQLACVDRRTVLKCALVSAALVALPRARAFADLHQTASSESPQAASMNAMKIMCMIRYQIDPFQRDAFKQYAETWGRAIPRAGGQLVGYFLPYEGTNDIAWGLIAFESLAAYEQYRAKLKSDAESVANFHFAQTKRFILREERTFVEVVEGTFEVGK